MKFQNARQMLLLHWPPQRCASNGSRIRSLQRSYGCSHSIWYKVCCTNINCTTNFKNFFSSLFWNNFWGFESRQVGWYLLFDHSATSTYFADHVEQLFSCHLHASLAFTSTKYNSPKRFKRHLSFFTISYKNIGRYFMLCASKFTQGKHLKLYLEYSLSLITFCWYFKFISQQLFYFSL